ncbi:Gfo/Idh/MocA family protein [Synechococcus lacustris]|uniref:Gfo/Idh/MocA family protein n=1 Tax=Synechococcus lacustris TaxID=2116544 RepID=UPI0020CD50B1|nr:Gfo/Idh/MocA family oxidoreductase [Synechococcus lacustris]MCP9812232.1 Gfo/Idh/MocA family oxidoreductase [Synechococcus lacustris Maggiore-St4-Slac]
MVKLIDRVLIVGLGSIGKRHLRLARGLMPYADIRVLRHQNKNEVPEYSNGSFTNLDEAVAFKPQIAVIASPASFHVATSQSLAENGVHLLVEKPLSNSFSGVARLLETCRDKDLALLTGYNLRFLPSLQRYRDLLGERIIGNILSVRCEIGQYLPTWRPDTDYRASVSARSEMGGGVLLELSHELDYLRWIFGEVEWVKATLSQQSELEINVEDSAHLTLGFQPKANKRQLIAQVNLDFIRHDTTRICTAIGEKGTLRWNGLNGDVSFYPAGSNEWLELFSYLHHRDESYLAEWKNFMECIVQHKKLVVTGEDGLKVLEIIEAARISDAAGGQSCNVSSIPIMSIS